MLTMVIVLHKTSLSHVILLCSLTETESRPPPKQMYLFCDFY